MQVKINRWLKQLDINWKRISPSWYSGIMLASEGRDPRFSAQSQQPEIDLGIIVRKRQKSTGNHESTLALKPMGRVIPYRKQRVPGARQDGPWFNKKFFK